MEIQNDSIPKNSLQIDWIVGRIKLIGSIVLAIIANKISHIRIFVYNKLNDSFVYICNRINLKHRLQSG